MSDFEIIEVAAQIGGAFALIGGGVSAARVAWRYAGTFGLSGDLAKLQAEANIKIAEAQAQAEAARAAAMAAQQPRSLHYAPHITQSSPASPPAPALPLEPPEPGELPGMVDLSDLAFYPTRHAILLGLGPGGQPLTVPAKDLMHTGLIGASGGGKSNTGRLILSQLLSCGVECVLADPHFTTYDAEHDEDWGPIAKRLKIAPARKAGEIEDLFGWLDDELQRRLDLRADGQKVGLPIVAYVDELPSIVANVEGAMDTLSALLREGRKVALYLVSASQDLLTKTLRSGGEIRENLRSCFYSGGAAHSAAPLLDMARKEIGQYEKRLGRGVVLLRSAATPEATLARVPLASNRAIAGLLSDDAPTMQRVAVQNRDDPRAVDSTGTAPGQHRDSNMDDRETPPERLKTVSPEAARVKALFLSGHTMADIIREVKGVDPARGGRAAQQARTEIEALLREVMA